VEIIVDKDGKGTLPAEDRAITYLLLIEYADANEVANVLRQLKSNDTDIVVYLPLNTIILSGNANEIGGLTRISRSLDKKMVDIKDDKARKGNIGDMELNLPEPLRKRINATIREGSKNRAYVLGAFVTGLLISFLELACTGQIYLPTIIFVSSIPELCGRAIFYLVLYNLMFIIPLIVVFIMAYYGTTSKQLTEFLKKNAAAVKLGMALLFIALAAWLVFSLLA